MKTTDDMNTLPVIPPERVDDLHNLEIAGSTDLNLFMAGNQFMVMKELIASFQQENPDIGNIFYETLPPGLELKQILAGGADFNGRIIDVIPDVYTSVSEDAMKKLVEAKLINEGDYSIYLHNRLTLMVPEGNPACIEAVDDLGREDVRISQPDPENEDIGHHIINMYRQAGGDGLVNTIMNKKRESGTTMMTKVHHRETPVAIMEGAADVGPVWSTEIVHAQVSGQRIEAVNPGSKLDQHKNINYYICALNNSGHSENARVFIGYIKSPEAQEIYRKYGFVPLDQDDEKPDAEKKPFECSLRKIGWL